MRALAALLLIMALPLATYAATAPHSSVGNVNCAGKEFKLPADGSCSTVTCTTDADCVEQKDKPPGGMPYGCLPDIHACGWALPVRANHSDEVKGN